MSIHSFAHDFRPLGLDPHSGIPVLFELGHNPEPVWRLPSGLLKEGQSTSKQAAIPVSLPHDSTLVPHDLFTGFYQNGFFILKNAVPENLINETLRSINEALGKFDGSGVTIAEDGKPSYNVPNYLFQNMFNQSPVLLSAIGALIGPNNL